MDPDNAARRLYESHGYRHDGSEPYLSGVREGTQEWLIDMAKPL